MFSTKQITKINKCSSSEAAVVQTLCLREADLKVLALLVVLLLQVCWLLPRTLCRMDKFFFLSSSRASSSSVTLLFLSESQTNSRFIHQEETLTGFTSVQKLKKKHPAGKNSNTTGSTSHQQASDSSNKTTNTFNQMCLVMKNKSKYKLCEWNAQAQYSNSIINALLKHSLTKHISFYLHPW